jgi:hypothetical protein
MIIVVAVVGIISIMKKRNGSDKVKNKFYFLLICGISLVVERLVANQQTGVRFPDAA